MNASKDFINYLVRTEQIAASEVPEETKVGTKTEEDDQGPRNGDMQESGQQQQRSVFQVGILFFNISSSVLKGFSMIYRINKDLSPPFKQ